MDPQATARVISDREFVLEHTFRAPAAKVFAAYTDPRLVPRWWAPPGGSLRVDVMDVRAGGKYRYVQRAANGHEMVFFGTYLDVHPVTRLVYTYAIEGQPANELRATVELAEKDGVTRLTLTNLCASKEARDAMLQYGAAAGAKVVWDRLAEVLRDG
ncbi:MAG: hypothetical protein QOE90_376 [Thermoplasmata archaeon]|jgi:uncharacterized protein YndB with AHSA1/START domain|nr:hypothetical protein [Thermoplasmata archaeon]